jgi:hypothetical protein
MRKGRDISNEENQGSFAEFDEFIRRSKRAGKIEDRRLKKLVKAIHESDSNQFNDDYYDDDIEQFRRGHHKYHD